MDELDELLTERGLDVFDEPGWMGYAFVHTLLTLDREQRAIQLADWRAAAAAGIERARVTLLEADRFLTGLRAHVQRALADED
jgi:hypothetical protein